MDEIRRSEPILREMRNSENREAVESLEQRATNLQQGTESSKSPLPQQQGAAAVLSRGQTAFADGSAGAAAPAKEPIRENADERGPLFSREETGDLRAQWDRIEVGFVDEPRNAVSEADQLVAAAMKRLSDIFQDERERMERQWDQGDKVSTEDLRLSLRRYRSFFGRLLSV